MENSMGITQNKLETELPYMIQKSYFLVNIQKKWNQYNKKIYKFPHLLQNYSQ
jgi:hypothetical protein